MRALVFFQKRQAGFTLTELLVALVVSSLTTTALLRFFSLQTTTLREQNARRAAQVTARGALNFIVRELEHVGRDPHRTLFTAANPALQQADDDILHYHADFNTDWASTPDVTGDWEDITFRYNADAYTIEVVRGDTAYPLTDGGENQKSHVPADGLVFTYFGFDNNGNEVPVAPGGNAAARASIRRINIFLRVRPGPPGGSSEPEVTLSQDVILRNVS
jgi:prepilin-type N-terminal cleavage/methylation domain-containing protein